MLAYTVTGTGKLVMPPETAPERRDGLWQTTCFELFLRFADDERYVEFNFSPSTRWAAYSFSAYREGMEDLDVAPPLIDAIVGRVEANCLLDVLPHGDLAMALTAVIEEAGGVKSYWALAHPPGPPDFHHPACFAATLPAPERP